MNRILSWFSCGAASAVATKLAMRERAAVEASFVNDDGYCSRLVRSLEPEGPEMSDLVERMRGLCDEITTLRAELAESKSHLLIRTQQSEKEIEKIEKQNRKLEGERDEWIECHAKVFRELQETKTLLGNKCAELAEAKKDAERYRYFTAHLNDEDQTNPLHVMLDQIGSRAPTKQELDAAIDAAIAGEKK